MIEKVRLIIFSLIIFGMPHVLWIPQKLGIDQETIPLGLGNLILIAAALLWIIGQSSVKYKNPLIPYNYFLGIVIIGVFISLSINLESDILISLTNAKREVALMLLYFLPLAFIKNEGEFLKVFVICLVVHMLIGYEVLNSGVLSGSNFGDHKRGSGPFGEGFQGSDVAGSYLAQVVMFFLAIVFTARLKLLFKVAAGLGAFIIIAGILSTYGRGAIIAVICGGLLMAVTSSISSRTKIASALIISLAVVVSTAIFLPESIKTRFSGSVNSEGQIDESTEGRLFYWKTALLILKEYPLGVGTGQIRAAMRRYTGSTSLNTGTGTYVDPHNGFLHTACEYGIIGLIVFIWFLWSVLIESKFIFSNSSNPLIYRTYALGMIGFIGALVACNMFYSNFYKDLVLGTISIHCGMLAYIKTRQIRLSRLMILMRRLRFSLTQNYGKGP